ncbi:hypothetical protein ACIBHX_26675 [Nonomuraea sp. NPDC050536]|uniref:hypothetical protein n=1 Tax=Nonomuraea sp. NPDC050536 TaxID=3364366 RepID=UPI0037CAF0A0
MTWPAGCGTLSEEACRQDANRQISELKRIVQPLLPDAVAATAEGDDGCDSGDGGWLHFTTDRAATGDRLFAKFLARGWKRVDAKDRDACGDCIDGVTKESDAGTVDVTMGVSQDDSRIEVWARLRR